MVKTLKKPTQNAAKTHEKLHKAKRNKGITKYLRFGGRNLA